jgi:hypothetical protein
MAYDNIGNSSHPVSSYQKPETTSIWRTNFHLFPDFLTQYFFLKLGLLLLAMPTTTDTSTSLVENAVTDKTLPKTFLVNGPLIYQIKE